MKRFKFKKEHIDFLRENKVNTEKDLIKMFYNKFGYLLNESQLSNAKHRYGLQSGLVGGQFMKGETPFNKGKKQIEYMSQEQIEKTKSGRFKKGDHSFNNANHNHREVGAERITKDGFIEIKIAEPNKWALKHRLIYESHYGKIPKDSIISFADGNKQNIDITNLILMKRCENLTMNMYNLYSKNSQITKTGHTLSKLLVKINKK